MSKIVYRLCGLKVSRASTTHLNSQPILLFSSDAKNSDTQTSQNERKSKEIDPNKEMELPEEPTNCCMSGCANCVYIEYASKLMENFELGGDKAQKIILEKIKDPSMKAFLEMELRMKLQQK